MVSRTTPDPLFPTAPIRPAPLETRDGARHRRLKVDVEVRPVDAVNGHQLASVAHSRRNGSDLVITRRRDSSFDVNVLGLGVDPRALADAARRSTGGSTNQRLISRLVVDIGVVPRLAAKPAC